MHFTKVTNIFFVSMQIMPINISYVLQHIHSYSLHDSQIIPSLASGVPAGWLPHLLNTNPKVFDGSRALRYDRMLLQAHLCSPQNGTDRFCGGLVSIIVAVSSRKGCFHSSRLPHPLIRPGNHD